MTFDPAKEFPEPRTHVTNPSITAIMHTVGGHQDKIVRAIQSFREQTYQNTILFVVNSHPDRLIIHGKPPNVVVHNTRDVFTKPLQLYAYSLKRIITDCWTILDDDDWISPKHIEQLVGVWNDAESRSSKPLQVCVPHAFGVYDDGVKPLDFQGWCNSLFERVTPEEVDYIYARFPADRICGLDTWIANNSYFDQRKSTGNRTYHWDRTGPNHVSSHETLHESHGERARFEIAKRYWKYKLWAHEQPLAEITLGH